MGAYNTHLKMSGRSKCLLVRLYSFIYTSVSPEGLWYNTETSWTSNVFISEHEEVASLTRKIGVKLRICMVDSTSKILYTWKLSMWFNFRCFRFHCDTSKVYLWIQLLSIAFLSKISQSAKVYTHLYVLIRENIESRCTQTFLHTQGSNYQIGLSF